MSKADVQAAVTRLMTFSTRKPPPNGTPARDLFAVLDDWQRDNPTDSDDPVTAEWLKSVGFREADLSWRVHRIDGVPEPNAFTIGGAPDVGDDTFGIWAGDGKWAAYHLSADGFDGSETWLCWTPTRGHVRRLLAALSLTEPA